MDNTDSTEYYGSEFYYFIHDHFGIDEVFLYRNLAITLQGLYLNPLSPPLPVE